MTNKEKFLALVSNEKTDTTERNRERVKNRAMLRESQQIAIKVLTKLDDLGWSQKRLAQEMDVSPQQISKIVSGKENLTIETQIRLQNILNIPVLASYYESKMTVRNEWTIVVEKRIEKIVPHTHHVADHYQLSKMVRKERLAYPQEYQIAVL